MQKSGVKMLENYKKLLTQFVQFKSISTTSQYQNEIIQTAKWLNKIFQEQKFDSQIIQGYDNPIILAHHQANPSYKTCLIYGHYDVQPAEKSDGWESDPFELTETQGRLFARGAIDNKGQVLVHIASIFNLINENKLGYNITFMIEGNEETGSPHLEKFILDNQSLLQSDFVMLSDGEITANKPVVELGFRGGANATITLTTATNDLHSGIYGGIAPNAALEMSKLLNSVYDQNNRITVPHFYDDVSEIDQSNTIPFDITEYQKITGAKAISKEPEFDEYSCVGLRPSIQITGIQSGYTQQGYRNGIPFQTVAKINFRLVKNQNPEQILKLFKQHLQDTLPSYVDYQLETSDPYHGVKLDVKNEYVDKAIKLLTLHFKETPILKY
ncbi:MAG: M20/M25/M40 family metallo-hydrolase, partial [bacterium]|nr:M20/M25/M40 family metallo-hydrolase [bacterium]